MPRKKTADKPVPSSLEKARAPGSSSTAVTHKHKKSATAAVADVAAGVVAAVETAISHIVRSSPTHEEIAIRAYHLAESRGFQGGSPDEDWLRAERELIASR